MTLNDFMDLKKLASISGHTPGSLTLKFDMRILSHPAMGAITALSGDKALQEKLKTAGFVKASVNPLFRTLTILYDPEKIGPDVLDDVFGATGSALPDHVVQVAQLLGLPLEA